MKKNLIGEMRLKDRIGLALAVFLLFGMHGPLNAMASAVVDPVSPIHMIVIIILSGGMSAALIFSVRRPLLIGLVVVTFTVSILYSSRIARWLGAPMLRKQISSEVIITPEDFRVLELSRSVAYGTSAAMLGMGWVAFFLVITRETQRRVKIQSEMSIAKGIQESLLPGKPLVLQGCTVFGKTVPASEVGGDYFDYLELPDKRVAVIIADVSGHGVGAGIIAAMTKSAFYLQLERDPEPAAMLTSLNSTLARITDKKTFVTCAYLLLDIEHKVARYSTAGHPPILLKTKNDSQVTELSTKNPALGMVRTSQFIQHESSWTAGDQFLFYTDGITEPTNKSGLAFGSGRTSEVFNKSINPTHLADDLIQQVVAYSGKKELQDDATVVHLS